jgi:hypothetical protein
LTLPLFFLIPRLNSGNVGGNFGEAQMITGFSDTVRLGDIASIKTSSRVVMRVKLDRIPAKWLRWRGIALDSYDGRAWTFTRGEKALDSGGRATGFQGGNEGSFIPDYQISPDEPFQENLGPGRDRTGRDPERRVSLVRQEFYLEPLNIGTLFAARKLTHIKGPFKRLIAQNETGAVSIGPRYGRLAYTVWSDIRIPSEQELRGDATRPVAPKEPFLQLPTEKEDHFRLDPRVQALAHEITRGLPDAYDRARAIETYLKTHYGYSLDLKYSSDDPLAEFLFNGKEGHCEYFATAMVIMLRTLHIPARIVNGFQMGEYNDISEMYVVRDRDAHSWVEAYFPGSDAWVEFDPTPSAGINDYSHGGLMARLMKYVDAAEVFWMDYIVTLDRGEQASIMIALQRKLLSLKEGVLYYCDLVKSWVTGLVAAVFFTRRWSAADLVTMIAGLLLLGALLLAGSILVSHFRQKNQMTSFYGPWWLRLFVLPNWRGAFWLRHDSRRPAILFYQQMLSILSRRGVMKRPDQTPIEFAEMQGSILVRDITDIYNRVRFGGDTLDEREARRVGRLLSELKRSIKQKKFVPVPPARGG